ncbi:MAG: phenylacetate--CoA ligase family protein, partial [Brevundimonas sp.]|nr:phenylacetate--CoA ligase family protein [Brevundimonas sp.]
DIFGGLKAGRPNDLKAIGTTSGTTGDPTPVPRGARTLSDRGGAREWWMAGARPGEYAAHLLFTFRGGLRYRAHRDAGIIPIYFQHSPHEVPRLIEASRRYRPTFIRSLSSPLINAIEQYFERTGEDPVEALSSYRAGIFGGEALSPRKKQLMKDWGIELFENTALGEVCGATECNMHDGMHIHEDFALAECLDPNGDQPVKEGELGELVVTSLEDPLNALIRFRTDDLVTMTKQKCGCGRTFARYKPQGRKGDLIEIEGKAILPKFILGIVENNKATRAGLFQIIRPSQQMDELRLRVGYDDTKPVPASLADDLHDQLKAELGVPVRIELVADSVLLRQGPPHKIPRVTKS